MTINGKDGLELAVEQELRKSGMSTADARALVADMDDEMRHEYLNQTEVVVRSDDLSSVESALKGEIKEHEYFASARGADTFLGPQGRFQEHLGTAGRGAGKGVMVAAAVFGGVGLSNFLAQPAYADTPASIDQLLPASGHLQGVNYWSDRVDVFSMTAGQLELDVTFTPRADQAGEPVTVKWYVPGGTAFEMDDPLTNLFSISEDTVGSLSFHAVNKDAREFAVQSYFAADGQYGQFFPSVSPDEAVQAGSTVLLPTTVDVGHYRVNAGFTAFEDGTHLQTRLLDPLTGEQLGEARDLWLGTGMNNQLNDVYARHNTAPTDNAVLEVQVVSGSAGLYGSVVDGHGAGSAYPGTGDATNVTPLRPSDAFTFLELGKIPGANGSSWQAQGSLTNHSGIEALVNVDYIPRDGGPVEEHVVTIPANATLGYSDIFTQLLNWAPDQNGVGTFTFTVANDPADNVQISGVARSFSILTEGCEDGQQPGQGSCEQVGTAGQLVRGMTAADALQPGETYHFLGLRQFQHDDGLERSHVGFYNPGETVANVTITKYDAVTGQEAGTATLPVAPGQLARINNVLGGSEVEIKRVEVTTDQPVLGAAYRVNEFNDPISIDAILEQRGNIGELQAQINAAEVVNPIIDSDENYTITISAQHTGQEGRISGILVDGDGDGNFNSMGYDQAFTFDDSNPAPTVEVTIPYDGNWSGADVDRHIRIDGTFYHPDNGTTSFSETYEAPLHVNRVSSLEHAWITDPARSAEVITYMQDHKQEISDLLAQGNPQCADTSEEYQEFIDIATGFDDIYFLFSDNGNRMSAWSEQAQEGGSMGCVYEAPFDGVLEMVAQYLIDNPAIPKNATTTTTALPTHTTTTGPVEMEYTNSTAGPVEMHYTK